jgi:23S rRNA (cytidine1920-2'-O)/16S rRNA (cytidine1409-2'-O)-methyltransferase
MMPPRQGKTRLDELLVLRGLAENKVKAQALIMAGLVEVPGLQGPKAGSSIPTDSVISLKEQIPYVSRGGLKLEGALDIFAINVSGKICLDIGASTGGFTDCLLQRGAQKVYSVDVGHGLMHPKISGDPRVVNIENTNFRNFDPEILKEPVEFCTIDVSFISLKSILPVVAKSVVPGGEVLAMVKPQFEAGQQDLVKGVVVDTLARQAAITAVREFALSHGFVFHGGADSKLKGPQGNVEHFLWLRTERR